MDERLGRVGQQARADPVQLCVQVFLILLRDLPLLLGALAALLLDGGEGGAGGEAIGRAIAQHEHEQAVIMHGARADELAIAVDRHFDAVNGALQGDILELADAMIERRLPGGGEFLRAFRPAQHIGAFRRHADAGAGMLDRSGIGERGDEIALALLGPAILARSAAGDWGEVWQGGRREVAVFLHGWDI